MTVDRRAFLWTGLGAAAAAAVGGMASRSARGAAQSVARRQKLSLKWGMIEVGSTVADKFDILKRLGYDGVEIDSPSDLNLDEVIEASKRTGIVVEGVVDSVHWSQPLSSDARTFGATPGMIAFAASIHIRS